MRAIAAVALLAAAATAAGAQVRRDSTAVAPARTDTAGRRPVEPPPAPPPDPWLGGDKLRHFVLAGSIQGSAFGLATAAGVRRDAALVSATAVTAALSVAKESHDRRRGRRFSVRDLAWDAAGVAVWSVLVARAGR